MSRSDHLVAVPNVSEGRDAAVVARLRASVEDAGARVLDVHSDPVHNRSVVTAAAEPATLIDAMVGLAREAQSIDLSRHTGVHPRLGVLDVCPFVVDGRLAREVVDVARAAGRAIAARAGIPVYLYALAATRPECERLPDLRRGGLQALAKRSAGDLPPDFGPPTIDPRVGVTCVGARGVLIAFNVWLRADAATARGIAAEVRAELGAAGVRALGLDAGDGLAQVSMNLTEPARAGIEEAFAAVAARARAAVHATELVGLPPERFMPDPDAEAARLLLEPGRSLERVLAG
ncbi:MAG TPA: glutamate formiminotransferase [Actinomycetota bacterium]|nr:glutamate formiminotransferase [Actinomycetota bacterium]